MHLLQDNVKLLRCVSGAGLSMFLDVLNGGVPSILHDDGGRGWVEERG